MAKADRLERLDIRRVDMEEDYLRLLVSALQRSAAGSWGLFGHNQDRPSLAKWAGPVKELCDLGQEIDKVRDALGLEAFALHQEFEASRGAVATTAPGEPKQARAWLARLGIPAESVGG
jgi:hypothetical protein